MALLPDRLGPFELQRRLGAGGMAETFLAVRRGPAGFEQRVCIKRILPAYESDQDFVTSFLAEARTSASLRHANIVQVLDFGAHEGSHYLALELIDGLDLRGLLARDTVLDAELVVLIAAEIAAALAYAHSADEDHPQVIHRDISPSNVLVSRNGELKLTDFGIARVVGGSMNTASGVIKGKIPYMPPEYIDGGKFDARGDLFALGVMLFELLHGFRPFDGDSELDTLRRIANGDRKPFTASAGPAVLACIERCLAKDPAKRYADARELLDALPTVHTHRARKRLAELVRARTSRVPGESQAPSWRGVAEHARTVPVTPSSPAPSTRPPPATQLLPSRKALYALLASSLVLIAVVVTALFRLPRGPASASAPPLLPAVPASETLPTGLAPASPALAPAVEEPAAPESAPAMVEAPAVAVEAPAPEAHASRKRAELNVVVLPFGEVWIDGKHVGLSPQRIKLAPGEHEIGVGEGRPRETRSVSLAPGEHEEVVFRTPKRER
ncbi:MAG TPA: serine/threonine-protein kinase [Polyangiales bacterium]|nr:serine/threonine-protein kinase [Polyangiales bacterium]